MNHGGMFYVGLSAQFPVLTMSLGRKVLKGWEPTYKISQFTWVKKKSFFLFYIFRYLPLPLLLIHLLPLFLHVLVSSVVSIQGLLDFLSSTLTLLSNLEAHSILIWINWTFIRDQRKNASRHL
jgi:fumarate reductase subunit C